MPEIAIQLDPSKLTNPDADLRYVLADLIVTAAKGSIKDDGYDYGPTSGLMTIYLHTTDLAAALPVVLDIIQGPAVLDNRLADEGAIVATSTIDHCSAAEDYSVMFPTAGVTFSLE